MLNYKELAYAAKEPYPQIQVKERNPACARSMLDNLGGSHSEMSAVSLYFYNRLLTGEGYEDIAYIFHKISIVEMHHLEIFGSLALQFGENPRLWSFRKNRRYYWTPAYNEYPTDLGVLVRNSLQGELHTIQKYEQQLSFLEDEAVQANLKRILADEKIHANIFQMIINEYHL